MQSVRHIYLHTIQEQLHNAILYLRCAETRWAVSFHYWKNFCRLTHWKCEKCNCTPDATERTNALAGTAEWCSGIYGEKCYFTSSLYSSQMASVKECTGLKQAKAKEGQKNPSQFKQWSLCLPLNRYQYVDCAFLFWHYLHFKGKLSYLFSDLLLFCNECAREASKRA